MSSLTAMIRRREWEAVVSAIPSEASVEERHLHEACKYDPPKRVVEAFVQANEHFRTAADNNGQLPIHTACFYGASGEVIEFLAEWDPQSLSVGSRVGNRTPLEIAQTTVWQNNGGNQGSVIQLLQKRSFPAFFDDMTGLPKKKAFEEWAHVSPSGKCFAFVCFIDIAGFKYINKTGGQNAGDDAIKWYASSIDEECLKFEAIWASENAAVRLTIDIFRVGGDEFVVVVKSAADAEESSRKRVWTAICSTLLPNLGSLKESTYHTFARVGCSAGMVSTSADAEAIRKRAENLQNELNAQLKTNRGEEPVLSEFHADGMSKVNICNRLLEWDPILFRSECRPAVAQSIQNTEEQQEDPFSSDAACRHVVSPSFQSTSVQHWQTPKKASAIDVYFHFQPPPTIKDAYTASVETEHISYLKIVKKRLADKKEFCENNWSVLSSCHMVLSTGKTTTLKYILPHSNVRAIIWCAEGVDVNTSREDKGFLASIGSAMPSSILPDVAVVILKYSPRRAAIELLSRGVRTVIWIRMDVYDRNPSIVLMRLFLPICDALLRGKDPRASLKCVLMQSGFFSSLSDGDFGVKGADVPEQVHYGQEGERKIGLQADLKGCEVCNQNIFELVSSEEFRDLKVQSSDLQFLKNIRTVLDRELIHPLTKIYIQMNPPDKDGDEAEFVARTRAIAWETCKRSTIDHSDLLDGVFRVESISELSKNIETKLPMCALLLWVDLKKSASSDAWKIDPDSKVMLRKIRDQCEQLLVIFTTDENHLEVMKLMKHEMGLKIGFHEKLPTQLPGTNIPASSMHHCISVVPSRKNGCKSDESLLDIVVRDPAKFERAFGQIVLSFPTKSNRGAEAESFIQKSSHADFPQIVALYRDDNDNSIKVRLCFSDVIFLMRLCGRILSDDATAEKLADAVDSNINFQFDRSAFAVAFENALLQFENMTPHQREKMKKCEGERLVHVEARAGTGKTFLAVNISLSFLRRHRKKILLYASSSKALCFTFVKWLCKRPMEFEELEHLLPRLFLIYPGKRGEAKMVGVEYDEESRKLKGVERKIPMNKGGKVVVDEAHHVFDSEQTNMLRVASKINGIITRKIFEVLILSDVSQQSSGGATYPKILRTRKFAKMLGSPTLLAGMILCFLALWSEYQLALRLSELLPIWQSIVAGAVTFGAMAYGTMTLIERFSKLLHSFVSKSLNPKEKWCEVELTEVVRSCQRIVAGAMTYQLANKTLTHCTHDIEGPPLMTYIFDSEQHRREEIEVYADKIVDAITDLSGERFRNLDLHDRLAILVPDDDFRDQLKGVLKDKLEATLEQTFHLETALESSESLNLGDADVSPLLPTIERCFVLDSVSNFHGQERLVVFGVDLDRPIQKRGDVGLVRSRIYQTITRAQMMFCLVNKSIKGGWFEWLQNVENNDGAEFSFEEFVKNCNDAAADVVKRYAADDAALNSAVVAREDQTGPKDIPQLSESESTRELGPTPNRMDGSEAETEQENDSIYDGAERSDENDRIHDFSVWDTSKNDRMLGALSGNFVPIRKNVYTLRGHTHVVRCCAVFANGARAISGSSDKTLKVWDVESGEDIHTLQGHTSSVTCCAVFAGGTRAISGSRDKTLKEWDVESGRELRTLKGHTDFVLCCTVFAHGTRAISGSFDKTLKVWEVESGMELRTLEGHTSWVSCCAVFAAGTRAISGCGDGGLKLWDLGSGSVLQTLNGHTDSVRCCAVFAEGTRAVSGSRDFTLKVWDLRGCEMIRTLEGHTDVVTCCAVFANGTRAINGSADETLKVWDTESGAAIHTLRGHTSGVRCCAVFPDGTRAISGGTDNTLKVWNLPRQ